MRRILTLSVAALMMVACGSPVKLSSGDATPLARMRQMNVVFDYEDVKVGDRSEAAYLHEKVSEKNRDEAGSGDEWRDQWFADREEHYEPKFMELFNKSSEVNLAKDNEDAEYTLVVKVTRIEPGFHAGIVRRNAEVDFTFTVLDRENGDEEVVTYEFLRARGEAGHGYDFTTTSRIRESFALGGRALARKLDKDRG